MVKKQNDVAACLRLGSCAPQSPFLRELSGMRLCSPPCQAKILPRMGRFF